jgi:hypothetical protein
LFAVPRFAGVPPLAASRATNHTGHILDEQESPARRDRGLFEDFTLMRLFSPVPSLEGACEESQDCSLKHYSQMDGRLKRITNNSRGTEKFLE